VSDKVDSLPITIRSRCQYIHLNSPPEAEGLSYFQQKGVDANDEDKKIALDLAKGAPMLAVSFFENEGLAQYRQLKQDFNQVLRAKANPITLAESWQEYDLLDILKQLQYQLKKQLLSRENHQSNATYWQVYDCLLSTIKLTSTRNNLNNKLLAEEFLVTIMKICQQNK